MTFHLACVPPKTSHHSKRIIRIGRVSRLADSDALNAAKDTIDVLLLPHRPPLAMAGPLRLDVAFTWPWVSGDSKRTRATGRVWHARRPDCSNVLKTLEDRLVALRFLEDDGQVVSVSVQKYRGDTPGITVTMEAA